MAHASARSARADVYSRITDEIVAAIERGAGDRHISCHHDGGSIARPRNVASDRPYRGINEAQVDGTAPRELRRLPEAERIAHADAFLAALKIPIVFDGSEACYRLYIDTAFMPLFERFVDAASFYSMLEHVCGHAVSHASRLNRDLTGRFGSAKYAMDEAVELTADLGIAHRPREEHAAYLRSWLPVPNSDPRALFTAAGKAQQAADWMHAQQPARPALCERERGERNLATGP